VSPRASFSWKWLKILASSRYTVRLSKVRL